MAAFLSSLTGVRDGDTFHLLAEGRDILNRGGFPREEPFLYPLAGSPLGTMPSWLSGVFYYLAWRVGGEAGPVVLAALAAAATFALLLADALDERPRSWGTLFLAVGIFGLALAVFRTRATARPEMFGAVGLALTGLALRRHERGDPRLLAWGMPPAFLLWANLHQSVVAGLALLAAALTVGFAQRSLERWSRRDLGAPNGLMLRTASVATALCLGASFLSPSSLNPVRNGLAFVAPLIGAGTNVDARLASALPAMMTQVTEMAAPTAADWQGAFGWLVLLAIASMVAGFGASSARQLATAAAFIGLASTAIRFTVTAAIVVTPYAVRHLDAALTRVKERWRPMGAAVLALALLGLAWQQRSYGTRPQLVFGTSLYRPIFPIRATDYLVENGFRQRLFNTYHFGGYLEWRLGIPVFQDGRGLVPSGDEVGAFNGPLAQDAFDALDRKYGFDALVVGYPSLDGATKALAARSDVQWDFGAPRSRYALVAFDEGGMLYLRRDGSWAVRAERDEFRYVIPSSEFPARRLLDPVFAKGFVAEMRRAVREAPQCGGCRRWLAMGLYSTGQQAEAARTPGVDLADAIREVDGLLKASPPQAPYGW